MRGYEGMDGSSLAGRAEAAVPMLKEDRGGRLDSAVLKCLLEGYEEILQTLISEARV